MFLYSEDAIVELFQSRSWAYLKTGNSATSNQLQRLSECRSEPEEYLDAQTYFPIKTEISTNSELDNDTHTEHAFNVLKTEVRVIDDQYTHNNELNKIETYSVKGPVDQRFIFSSPLLIETIESEPTCSSNLLTLDTKELVNTDTVESSKSLSVKERPLRTSKRTKVQNRWISFDENMENSVRTKRKLTKLRQDSAVIGNKTNVKTFRRKQRTWVMPNNKAVDNLIARDGQQSPETDLISQLLQQFNESIKQKSGDSIRDEDYLENCIKVENGITESTGKVSDENENRAKGSVVKSNKKKGKDACFTTGSRICEVCNKAFSSPANLAKHMPIHADYKPYSCDSCEKSFLYLMHYKRHLMTHSREADDMDFSEKPRIQQRAEARHCCELCGKMYTTARSLTKHKARHDYPRPYSCEKCSKSFYSEDRLKSHVLAHSATADNLYVCTTCGNSYKDVGTLRFHMQNHSDNVWKCEKCEKVFKRSSYLRYHMMYVHDGVKRFCCHTCGKQYGRQTSLILHLASHTSERHFNCPTCGKSFKLKTALRKHEIVHKTEKRHSCSVCQRQFGRADNLRTHMLTHSTVKPHICNICGSSFNHAVSLRQHMHRHGSPLDK